MVVVGMMTALTENGVVFDTILWEVIKYNDDLKWTWTPYFKAVLILQERDRERPTLTDRETMRDRVVQF